MLKEILEKLQDESKNALFGDWEGIIDQAIREIGEVLPKKKEDTGDLTSGGFEQARNRGFNQAVELMEEKLGIKEDIYE